ncbi:MAG: TlpA family protein disulfide reductase, partial [Thermoguttaceae bacterium]|nr:TlpA family protein disulfide reductase [Thermoguttaceae bacterium]
RAMLPQLVELHEQYRDRGFDIVGVNLDDEAEAVESFLKENELPWATLFDSHEDSKESMGRYYGIRAIPTTVLVGKDGKVLATNLHGEQINEALAEQLGPAEEGKKGDAEPKEKSAGEKPEA